MIEVLKISFFFLVETKARLKRKKSVNHSRVKYNAFIVF